MQSGHWLRQEILLQNLGILLQNLFAIELHGAIRAKNPIAKSQKSREEENLYYLLF